MHTYVHMHIICLSACRSQKKAWQEIVSHLVWVLGTKLGPPGRVESTVSLIVEHFSSPCFILSAVVGKNLASPPSPLPSPPLPLPSHHLLFSSDTFSLRLEFMCCVHWLQIHYVSEKDHLDFRILWAPLLKRDDYRRVLPHRLRACSTTPRLCRAEDWGFHVRQALL